jgi:hypothetical protein
MKWREAFAILFTALLATFIADIVVKDDSTIIFWVIDISIVIVSLFIWHYIFYLIDKKNENKNI